jgi:hypothetical protein
MGNFYQLNEITLITVAGVNIESAANALLISSEFFKFGSIKLLSPAKPLLLHKTIEHIQISPKDFMGYQKFKIEELYKFVDTKYCLCIEPDGFVINPHLWTNEFLQYDYIGAPWPNFVKVNNGPVDKFYFGKNRVGNSGFSLRSKKLLEVCAKIKFDELNFWIKSEDLIICHFLYEQMLKAGIKFATLDLASKFSIESIVGNQPNSLESSFGFHGKRWLSNDYLKELAIKSNYSREYSSLLLS